MIYEHIRPARFLERTNRFLARVELEGRELPCHVKNTSRLRELLLPGARVSVQEAAAPGRKTPLDLIAVEHGGRWVNIDSQAPNKVFAEWVGQGGAFGPLTLLRPEVYHGSSRFDFYLESGARKTFVEVKGVTLVEGGVARFPGAPTTRGVKHVQGLEHCLAEGFEAAVVFVVKRDDVAACAPNDDLDPAFGAALRKAVARGVRALALDCTVAPDRLAIRGPVPVQL